MKKVILTFVLIIVSTQANANYQMVDLQAYEIKQAIADHYQNRFKSRNRIKEERIELQAIEGIKLDKDGKVESIDLGFNPKVFNVGVDHPEYCTVNIKVANNQITVNCQDYN